MSLRYPPHFCLIRSAGLVVALLVASHAGTASADCPDVDAAAECDSPGDDICELGINDTIFCDLTRVGDTEAATMYAVLNTGGGLCDGAAEYCVWGTEGTGEEFCCEYDIVADEDTLMVIGTSYADFINFQYDNGSAWNLEDHDNTQFDGKVLGNGETDTILGSRSNSADYHDDLHGDGGNDVIEGHEGNDAIAGDAGNDTLDGGPGNDAIFGGDGNDTINGSAGDDLMYGNGQDDTIMGGIGDDDLYGDIGADTLCGDDNTDELFGGGAADILWGGGGSDSGDGGDPSTSPGDSCDVESPSFCETTGTISDPCP